MEIYTHNIERQEPYIKKDKKAKNEPPDSKNNHLKTENEIDSKTYQIKKHFLSEYKSITKAQIILNSYQEIKIWMEQSNKDNMSQLNSDLNKLVKETKFEGENILAPVKDELTNIISENNRNLLDEKILLLEQEKESLADKLPYNYEAINKTIEQNLAAVQNNMNKEDIYSLMNEIKNDLKMTEALNLNITREKIIDLLE